MPTVIHSPILDKTTQHRLAPEPARIPTRAKCTLLPQIVWGIMIRGRAYLYEAAEFRFAHAGEIINWHNHPYEVGYNGGPFYQSLVATRNVSAELADARNNGRYWIATEAEVAR
jgi:hypothetical protein